ncbi:LytR C-terminal domain-containing protein [Patescibacteria group bacterium]|nr:LytR C-terminal domain-containing protein [Patescibacteria group bacterium]
MKNKNETKKNFNLAKIFIVFLVFLLIASISIKIFFVYANSRFDGVNRFTVKILAPTKAYLLTVSPTTESAMILEIDISRKDDFPLVGIDRTMKCICDLTKENLTYELGKMFLENGLKSSELTIFDISRLFLFSRSISAPDILEKKITQKTEALIKKEIESSGFIDSAIAREGLSIEVLNASEISGIGNKYANIISNAGGSVVMVQNAERNQKDSTIYYYEKEGYTVKKLAKLFNFKIKKMNNKNLADIKVILGKDILNNLK